MSMLQFNILMIFVLRKSTDMLNIYCIVVMLVCVQTKMWGVHLTSEDIKYFYSIFVTMVTKENKLYIAQGI